MLMNARLATTPVARTGHVKTSGAATAALATKAMKAKVTLLITEDFSHTFFQVLSVLILMSVLKNHVMRMRTVSIVPAPTPARVKQGLQVMVLNVKILTNVMKIRATKMLFVSMLLDCTPAYAIKEL